jgi:hypothetical protein
MNILSISILSATEKHDKAFRGIANDAYESILNVKPEKWYINVSNSEDNHQKGSFITFDPFKMSNQGVDLDPVKLNFKVCIIEGKPPGEFYGKGICINVDPKRFNTIDIENLIEGYYKVRSNYKLAKDYKIKHLLKPLLYRILKKDKEVIIHEFIHSLDENRMNLSTIQKMRMIKQYKGKNYFKSPGEFNAFYQGGVSDFEDHVKDIGGIDNLFDNNFRNLSNNEKFKLFKKEVEKFIHPKFLEGIDKKFKRHYDKRLYNLYESYVS